MEQSAYLQEMHQFYDNPLSPVHETSALQHLTALEANFMTEGHWFREVVLEMQAALSGRQVLEVACGHGRWSHFIADAAKRVIATDNSPRLLAVARQIAECKKVPTEKLEFVETDAFELETVLDKYNGALVMNFLQHIPFAAHADFLEGLHGKLLPRSVVFMGANQFSTEGLYSMPGTPDTYDVRSRPDGSTYKIIDNVLSPDVLRSILAGRSSNLEIKMNDAWWWLTYTVA